MIPPSFSNLSNLAHLSLTNVTFQGFNRILFSILNHLLKIEEDFPSCFQNMIKLTKLVLSKVRGENPEPIPFPTQFCNMIYLQRFISRFNKFSGLER